MTKYVFVDDETTERIKPLCDALSDAKAGLEVEARPPAAFETELQQLRGIADGLILDHRLDEKPGNDGTRISYRGFTIAQEIRNRATDKADWEAWTYPIVLLSLQAKLQASYEPDLTSHDLFDAVHVKELVTDDAPAIRRQLLALAAGYRELQSVRKQAISGFERVRGVLGKNLNPERLDPRIVARLGADAPCHIDSQFVIRGLLDRPGVLVREALLAARLGIDRACEGWPVILGLLSSGKYEGIFRAAYPRWWWYSVEEWWRGLSADQPSLAGEVAADRVAAIAKATGEQRLKPAQPASKEGDSRFWTTCEETALPLDPVDAVRIAESEPEPWQNPRYVSMAVAANGVFRKADTRIHPFELRRVRAVQDADAKDV